MQDQGWFCPTIVKHIGAFHPSFLMVKFCQNSKKRSGRGGFWSSEVRRRK
jgi:hypothetical protein